MNTWLGPRKRRFRKRRMGVPLARAILYDRTVEERGQHSEADAAALDSMVARARAGDRDAFDGLVRRFRNEVFALAYHFVRNREEAWDILEKANETEERVEGSIFGRVKGGFTVDLGGAVAFLPGSQIDVRPVRDVGPLMGVLQPFQILKMDRRRGNIVVSRRAVLEESRAEQRAEIVAKLTEGDVVDGVVKNVTDYGAFVDLGGVDGLLHVTDMAWRRVNHPSEILSIGETIKVQVVRVNKDTQRISLGMKQLQSDPCSSSDHHFSESALPALMADQPGCSHD